MLNLITTNLIYIEEKHNAENKEHIKKNVKAKQGEVFNNKYYANLNRGIQLTSILKINDYHKQPYENGELRYCEIKGKRYIINRISKIKGKNILLDLEEEK